MASWRNADDPRCPECDEPIAATASYCMHCDADLPMDDSADVSDVDDVPRRGASTDAPSTGDDGIGAWLADRLSFNRTEYPGSSPAAEPTRQTKATSQEDGDPTSRETTPPTASLALRLPTAVFVSVPVPILSLFVALAIVSPLGGGIALFVFAGSWFAAIAWLSRRPLPSKVIGDGCYLIAGILVAGPVLNQADLLLRRVIVPDSVGAGIPAIVVGLFSWELVVVFPVAVLLLFGWAGNAWAARKLDPSEESERVATETDDRDPGMTVDR